MLLIVEVGNCAIDGGSPTWNRSLQKGDHTCTPGPHMSFYIFVPLFYQLSTKYEGLLDKGQQGQRDLGIVLLHLINEFCICLLSVETKDAGAGADKDSFSEIIFVLFLQSCRHK